jgi:glycosyltransferase involved in cell wall biosynthesis
MDDVVTLHCGPLTMVHAHKLGERLCVYDAVDEWLAHPAFASMEGPLRRGYERIRHDADIVTAVSPNLAGVFGGCAAQVHLVPNAVDDEYLTPSGDPMPEGVGALGRPVVGYVGAIQDRVDVALISDLSRAMPEVSICLVGPVLSESHVRPLREKKNIHFSGPVVHDRVRQYLAAFDVCVMPHIDTALTRCMDPVKLYEYVASGKPTVCSGVTVHSRFDGLVHRAATSEEFIAAVRVGLASGRAVPSGDVASFISENTWTKRIDALLELTSRVRAEGNPNGALGRVARAS